MFLATISLGRHKLNMLNTSNLIRSAWWIPDAYALGFVGVVASGLLLGLALGVNVPLAEAWAKLVASHSTWDLIKLSYLATLGTYLGIGGCFLLCDITRTYSGSRFQPNTPPNIAKLPKLFAVLCMNTCLPLVIVAGIYGFGGKVYVTDIDNTVEKAINGSALVARLFFVSPQLPSPQLVLTDLMMFLVT